MHFPANEPGIFEEPQSCQTKCTMVMTGEANRSRHLCLGNSLGVRSEEEDVYYLNSTPAPI